ncbi:MAG: cell division protein ZapA [Candidatus Competibacter sp.]|nr:cell division protein ZapA [Candidatus Competibacter sp.]MDG4583466.1 cell division protein ZapA [Candidatus Competibacter sp.]
MSRETVSVTVHLMGCEYRFACQPSERDDLLEAARYLDERMREVRDRTSKLLSLEAVAVMTALNVSNELLRQQHLLAEADTLVDRQVEDLLQKVDAMLSKTESEEL